MLVLKKFKLGLLTPFTILNIHKCFQSKFQSTWDILLFIIENCRNVNEHMEISGVMYEIPSNPNWLFQFSN